MTKLSYRDLQKALKEFKNKGLTAIALNSKKERLETEYDRLMNEQSIKPQPVAVTKTEEKQIATNTAPKPEKINSKPLAITEVEPINSDSEVKKDKGIITSKKENKPLKIDSRRAINSNTEKITDNIENTAKLKVIEATNQDNSDSAVTPQLVAETIANNEIEREKLEILKRILLVFVQAIVKILIKPNYFNRLIKKVEAVRIKINFFTQWYLQGFRIPRFV